MRRVLQALEQRAITATKVEVDWLISEASNSIQAYIEDNSNITELKHAVKVIGQTANTLQIMQVHGGVLLANETLKVIDKLIDGSANRVEESQDVVSRSIIRLGEYLEHVEAGNKDLPLVLMPLLNDLRASRDAALLSENVLFFPNIDGVKPPAVEVEKIDGTQAAWLRVIRTNFQKTLLACVSGKDIPSAAAQLCKLSIRLQRVSETENGQKLWWLASALSQAVAINALPFNASIASLFNALDKQIKLLVELGENKFSHNFDESIIKNILYYIAISEDRGRIVNQVKQAYALNEQVPQQQDIAEVRKQVSAPSVEVLITVSKALLEDIAKTKDCIELFIHSDLKDEKHIEGLRLGLQKISDTLSMIGIDEYKSKVEHQLHEVELIQSDDQGDIELLLLGISEVVLEVETCINNFIEYRINFQSTSKESNREKSPEADATNNEHKAAFSVTVSEVLLRIEQIKEMLTEVIHISFDEEKCNRTIQTINEIRGVISVIDLERPLPLLDGVTGYIESKQFKKDIYESAESLKDLADCIVGLQCYFEQLESRVPYADQILDHCSEALLRISKAENNEHKESVDRDINIDVDFNETMMSFDVDMISGPEIGYENEEESKTASKHESIEALPDLNALVDDVAIKEIEENSRVEDEKNQDDANEHIQVENAADEDVGEDDVNNNIYTKSNGDKSFAVLSQGVDHALVETFIEEAEQVIIDIKKSWDQWRSDQSDWQSFAEMRRGYHTLKGSGRFVGAELLSEFAWQFENLCNKCLGKKQHLSDDIQDLFEQSARNIYLLVKQLKDPMYVLDLDVNKLMKMAISAASENNKVSDSESTSETSKTVTDESKETLKNELTGIFAQEATQHLKVMREAIDDEILSKKSIRIDEELLRTVHTMRGSARTAGVTHISELCEQLENIITTALKHKIEFDNDQIQLVQSCVHKIETDLANIEQSKELDSPDVTLLGQLHELNEQLHASHADEKVNESASKDATMQVASSMVDQSHDRDEELCEIFFEEAEDVLASCQSSLQRLKENINDADALSELRRQFHTLKGSSRMAGFATIGELSHVTESLMVGVVDRRIDKNESIVFLLQRVVDILHANVEAAQRGQDIYLDDHLLSDVKNACNNSANADQKDRNEDIVLKEQQVSDEPELPVEELVAELGLENQNDSSVSQEADNNAQQNEPAPEVKKEIPKKFINTNKSSSEGSGGKEKHEIVRVPADVLDVLVNDAGEVNIQRARLDQVFNLISSNSSEFEQIIGRLREQLRKLEMETEAQILFKHADDQENLPDFDPLELDRYSDIQQLSRSLAESVDDLTNIREVFLNHMQDGEDVLVRQKVVTTNLQDNLLRTRMVRFDTVEPRLQRIVRQTSSELKKQVELVVEGGDIEVDRRVLNGVITAIEHILRNSVGHGIELPDVRLQKQKSSRGQIKIEIERDGSEISIVIKDDGAGIDPEKVKAKAVENGIISANANLDKEELLQLIFKSGLSTASKVTKIAGRGVGMDIVDKDIRRLGGRIEIRSAEDKGAKFILKLPFTLAVSQALLIQAGKEIYALTLSGIEGVIQLPATELKKIFSEGDASYTYAGHDYTFHHLASLLQGGNLYYEDDTLSYPVILVRVGDQRLALQVEASYGNKEIVVKPLAAHFSQVQGISGATILGDGKVALIIDIPWIARLIQSKTRAETVLVSEMPDSDKNDEATVMVVDDSITIRKVTTRFLERNNYKVITAKDGVDALQKLQKNVPDIVLLDIEMPRMDGYELATQMRKENRLQNIPIIMITSRTGDKHRNRALELGVDCYLGKPYNEQQLLESIERLN